MTKRVWRSTRVAIAERLALPMMRSPSQWPGTARSSTSAGRSLSRTMPTSSPLPTVRRRGRRWARPVRRYRVSSFRSTPRACTNSDW